MDRKDIEPVYTKVTEELLEKKLEDMRTSGIINNYCLEGAVIEFNNNGNKYWMNIEEWEWQQLWYEFREKLLYMIIGVTDKEVIKEAEEYLFNKYPQYEKFRNR